MLTTNCALAYLNNQLRLKEEYGICEDKYETLVKCMASYYWLYNNAWSCLTTDQQCDLDVFIKSNLNGISEVSCSDTTTSCLTFATASIVANLSNATNYIYTFSISPLAGIAPYSYLWSIVGGSFVYTNGTTATSSQISILNTDTTGVIDSTSVNCIIEDSQGCVVSRTHSILCTPYLTPTVYANQCITNFNINLSTIVDTSACNTTIDWVNTQFQLPAGISVVMVGSTAQFTSINPVGVYGIQIRIKTTTGFYSNWSTITVHTALVC